MRLTPGARLGSFEILELLGQGGMGAVYRAYDRKLARDVAIKVLKDDVALDRTRLERFQREARAASALNHPNIVTIHAIEELEGTLYLVMELVQGRTLRELMSEGRMNPSRALELMVQIAGGLAKAHDAGIVHRDVKPENLMVTDDGLIKIVDFGLAKLAHVPEARDEEALTADRNLTNSGVVVGTLSYMSPEQVAGRPVDARSDQFALGTILYEMVSGEHPFRRDSPLETLSAIVEVRAAPLAQLQPDLPSGLYAAVERALSKEPELRYPDLRELKAELETEDDALPELPSFLDASTAKGETRASFFVGRDPRLF